MTTAQQQATQQAEEDFDDPAYRSFVQHAKSRGQRHQKERKKILEGILKLRKND